jgi:hypothetical protein
MGHNLLGYWLVDSVLRGSSTTWARPFLTTFEIIWRFQRINWQLIWKETVKIVILMSHWGKITLAPAYTILQMIKTAILLKKGLSGQHNSKGSYRSNCNWKKKWHCCRLPAHKIKLFIPYMHRNLIYCLYVRWYSRGGSLGHTTPKLWENTNGRLLVICMRTRSVYFLLFYLF